MIFRILWVLLILSLGALIAGANTSNVTDISIIFYRWKSVPVFFTILTAFILGVLWAVPFLLKKGRSKPRKGESSDNSGPYSAEEMGE